MPKLTPDDPRAVGSSQYAEWRTLSLSIGGGIVVVVGVLAFAISRHRRKKTFGYPAVDSPSTGLMIFQRTPKKDFCYTKPSYIQDGGYNTFNPSSHAQYGLPDSLRMYEFNVRSHESGSMGSIADLPTTPCCGQSHDASLMDACGRVQLSLQYTVTEAKLCVKIDGVTGLNPLIVVLTAFLDVDQQSDFMKKWSDIQAGDDTFQFIVRPDDVANARLQLNVLVGSEENFSLGDCLNAEASFHLSELDEELDETVSYDLPLLFVEKKSQCDDIDELPPHSTYPQLLIGLMYTPNTGKLVVSILKGANYNVYCSKPDTFVKATLISPYGEEIEKHTTKLCQQNSGPQFDEEFTYQISDRELDYIHITISVFCLLGIWQRKTPIGVVTLGAQTGDKDIDEHWKQMKLDEDEAVVQWHRIVEP